MLIIKRGRGEEEEEVGRKEDKERRWEGGERKGRRNPCRIFSLDVIIIKN